MWIGGREQLEWNRVGKGGVDISSGGCGAGNNTVGERDRSDG